MVEYVAASIVSVPLLLVTPGAEPAHVLVLSANVYEEPSAVLVTLVFVVDTCKLSVVPLAEYPLGPTVSAAALVETEPPTFVNTARYWLPLSANETAGVV